MIVVIIRRMDDRSLSLALSGLDFCSVVSSRTEETRGNARWFGLFGFDSNCCGMNVCTTLCRFSRVCYRRGRKDLCGR